LVHKEPYVKRYTTKATQFPEPAYCWDVPKMTERQYIEEEEMGIYGVNSREILDKNGNYRK